MKSNLVQYLKEYGQKSFQEAPFTEVDALVLSQLSYLKMDGIVPGFRHGDGIGWDEIAGHPDAERLFADPLYGRQHRRVFHLIVSSRRYRHVRTAYYVEWFDEELEIQFAAVTFFLGETSTFVSYRGTDETIVGWKEDFNMSYRRTIPSQRMALAYLKGAARYRKGRLMLGGHSKGGNLAVYAAALAPEAVQDRVCRVYSFDGPGFQKRFYEKAGFEHIKPRFCKIVPEQSLVGMLFANYREYRVVRSYGHGFAQHDLMQWKIRNGKFVYRRELYAGSSRWTIILNTWFGLLDREQTASFVETLYDLLGFAHVSSVAQIVRAPLSVLKRMLLGFQKLDQARQTAFWKAIAELAGVIRRTPRRKKKKRNTKMQRH